MELRPETGWLGAQLFENNPPGSPPSLFFGIEIPVAPFKYRRRTQTTEVRLDFISLPVSDWRDLGGREFAFPVNPEPGYIDGSLYLGNVHNPADTTLIRFGRFNESTLPARLEIRVDFTYEGPLELGVVSLDWSTELRFDAQELDRVFADARVRGAR